MVTMWFAFVPVATLLIIAPGPDSLLVLRNAARGGRRAGYLTAAGTLSGLAVWAVAAALGVSALLTASRTGYDILRVAGAVYLIWLGLTAFGVVRGGRHARSKAEDSSVRLGWVRTYGAGFLSNTLNPKIGVFFVAFLPTFVPAGSSAAELLVLGGWFVVETGCWLVFVAWTGARGAEWMNRDSIRRWLDRITGTVLVGFGIRLLAEQH